MEAADAGKRGPRARMIQSSEAGGTVRCSRIAAVRLSVPIATRCRSAKRPNSTPIRTMSDDALRGYQAALFGSIRSMLASSLPISCCATRIS